MQFSLPAQRPRSQVRSSEWILVAYFVYTGFLAVWRHLGTAIESISILSPLVLLTLAYAETRWGNKATGVFREWISPGLVLLAYWQLNWFRQAYDDTLQDRWVEFDRMVLDQWGLRAAIESFGAAIPATLEFCYLLMYAIPPLALAVLYRNQLRSRVDQFLFTFLLGTLTAYALLPHFPTAPPRVAFPSQDLPGVITTLHRINVWLENGYDIRTSVFPSGHVAASFSAAFGMLVAFPGKKRFGIVMLLVAAAIMLTTIYGRYHYTMDAIAGLGISLCALGVSRFFHQGGRKTVGD